MRAAASLLAISIFCSVATSPSSLSAFDVIMRELPVAQVLSACRCQNCSGCATGAHSGWGRGPCTVIIRNDISGRPDGWREWVIQHEIGHCRHGPHYGH